MRIQDEVHHDILDVDGGLTEQILGEGGNGGVAVRSHGHLGEGGLAHGSLSAFGQPVAGDSAGFHEGHGTNEVTHNAGAELGHYEALLQAFQVSGGLDFLGVTAIGVGGVVLAGAGAQERHGDYEALLGEAQTGVLLGTHLSGLLFETGELSFCGLAEEFYDGEGAAFFLLLVAELLFSSCALGNLQVTGVVKFLTESVNLVHGSAEGSLVGLVHVAGSFYLCGQILLDFCNFTHSC